MRKPAASSISCNQLSEFAGKKRTIESFWTMVWLHAARAIVLATGNCWRFLSLSLCLSLFQRFSHAFARWRALLSNSARPISRSVSEKGKEREIRIKFVFANKNWKGKNSTYKQKVSATQNMRYQDLCSKLWPSLLHQAATRSAAKANCK